MAERELERDLLASSTEGSAVETEQLREEIKQALTCLNAVLVAHYYTDEAVQSNKSRSNSRSAIVHTHFCWAR